jgi:hypothetical protein
MTRMLGCVHTISLHRNMFSCITDIIWI